MKVLKVEFDNGKKAWVLLNRIEVIEEDFSRPDKIRIYLLDRPQEESLCVNKTKELADQLALLENEPVWMAGEK